MEADNITSYKCVVVGDDSVGKTSMLISYATRTFPETIVPDIFDNYAGSVLIGGCPHSLSIIDTSTQIDSEGLRKHLYQGTSIFLVCFSVVRPDSLDSVEERWLPDIQETYPDVPVIVIGTQADLRDDPSIIRLLANQSRAPLTYAQGSALAKRLGAKYYLETSPYSQRNVKPVFDKVLGEVLSNGKRPVNRRGNSNCKIM